MRPNPSGTSFPSANQARKIPRVRSRPSAQLGATSAKGQGERSLARQPHTLITDLAESGAGDQTIMDIAGQVSKQMLRHYSHIRMEAKRNALEAIVKPESKLQFS